MSVYKDDGRWDTHALKLWILSLVDGPIPTREDLQIIKSLIETAERYEELVGWGEEFLKNLKQINVELKKCRNQKFTG